MKADQVSILELLQEFLHHTRMIAQFQPGSEIDLTAHTEASGSLLASLQDVAGQESHKRLTDRCENAETKIAVETALRGLIEQSRQCCQVLRGHLEQMERELDTLRRKQRQVNAYDSQTT